MPRNIVFLTKRHPMGRDLISDPYGRFYHLPLELAKSGDAVTVVAADYRGSEDGEWFAHGLRWRSVAATINLPATRRALADAVERCSPDWIVGCSDTYFGILAQSLAAKFGSRSVIDAYDNYCAYIPWAKPLHWLWERALKRCDVTTVAGPSLAELWAPLRGRSGSVIVPMAADPRGYYLRDRFRARHAFGLPYDRPIVGYSGSINSQRGIRVLFEAIELARDERPDLMLVLSGRLQRGVTLPRDTVYLGYVPNDDVPVLMNCFDVMAVINTSSAFGNYSYPVKLYEAMACGIPAVVSRTRSTEWMMSSTPELLVEPDDPKALARGLIAALDYDRIDYPTKNTWARSAQFLHDALTTT